MAIVVENSFRPYNGRSVDFRRDFFSTHFDINYLPENQARTEALGDTSENGGRAAHGAERRAAFVARFHWARGKAGTVFSRVVAIREPDLTLSRPDFVSERYGDISTVGRRILSRVCELWALTTVRLKVEENQLVDVFDEIGTCIEGLKGA